MTSDKLLDMQYIQHPDGFYCFFDMETGNMYDTDGNLIADSNEDK